MPYEDLKKAVLQWRKDNGASKGEDDHLAHQAIHDDLEFWQNLGVKLVAVPSTRDARERWIIDSGAPHDKSKDPRSELRGSEKQAIANVCMGMICGFDFLGDSQQYRRTPGLFSNCARWEEIRAELTRGLRNNVRAKSAAERVINRLQRMYHEEARTIAFDAGTTNDKTVNLLSQLKLPTGFSKLCHLSVCTNSRTMFQKLGESGIDANVIMIGGEQRLRTDVVAGKMAEAFIASAGLLQFNITFVGATVIDLQRYIVCSDSQDEARLKSLLFERSSLRIVCADFAKWEERPMRSNYGFAYLDPSQFDLIITDSPCKTSNEPESDFQERSRRFDRIVSTVEDEGGIPVYRAPVIKP